MRTGAMITTPGFAIVLAAVLLAVPRAGADSARARTEHPGNAAMSPSTHTGEETPPVPGSGASAARGDAAPALSPYSGEQARAIKALSDDEVRGLLAGAGLGFAKTAELNHYPGPAHVLILADRLSLSPEQTARTRALYAAMKAEAVPLGKRILSQEKHLDALFASGSIDETRLREFTGRIGRLRGALRAVHLVYHLRMKNLLTPHQVASYDRLRGYVFGPGNHTGHGGHSHNP